MHIIFYKSTLVLRSLLVPFFRGIHNLNKLCRPHIPNATYQVQRSSAFWFWRRRFFNVFARYGRGGHLGRVTKIFCINFGYFIIRSLHMKFEFNWANGL